MSEGMERVLEYVTEFYRSIERYKEKKDDPVDGKGLCIGAYHALYQLMERIRNEWSGLENEERSICSNIRKDKFLEGLLKIRDVGTHVIKDSKDAYIKIYPSSGNPLLVPIETSANAMFLHSVVTIYDKGGVEETTIDHLKNLETGKDIITKILGKLDAKRP